MKNRFALRTDTSLFILQNTAACRTSGRVQYIQTFFFYFFQRNAFLPDDMLSFPVIEFFCRDLFGFLNALIQRAVSSLLLLISDHITESLLTSHNSNAFSRTCYCCIKKISVHQHSRTGKQWNDHCPDILIPVIYVWLLHKQVPVHPAV